MTDKTGGYAFPWCGDLNKTPTINLGMTLRDYFAAKAMLGAISSMGEDSDDFDAPACSSWAYAVADAMLKAREA